MSFAPAPWNPSYPDDPAMEQAFPFGTPLGFEIDRGQRDQDRTYVSENTD